MLQLKIVDFVQSKEYFEENGGTVSDNNHFKIFLQINILRKFG